MEERSIELVAKGHSVGETLEMSIVVPPGSSIGSPMKIELSFPGTDMEKPLDLSVSNSKGFEGSDISIEGTENDPSRMIQAVPLGKEGPSILKVFIKGEVYGATIAIQEVDLDLLPPQLDMSLLESPISISHSGKKMVILKAHMPGSTKFKGEIHLSLVDGSDRVIGNETVQQFSFKGSRTLEMELDMQLDTPGTYSFGIRVKNKDHSSFRIMKDALIFDGLPTEHISDDPDQVEVKATGKIRIISAKFQPRDVSPGEKIELLLEVERSDEITGPMEFGLVIGKHHIKEKTIPAEESALKTSISIPGSFRSGNTTAIITLKHVGETVLREVLPRAFKVSGSSQLNIRIATPSDLSDGDKVPNGEYIFPGEGVRSVRSMGKFEIMYLTTGRHLYLKDKAVVLGNGWDDTQTEDAFTNLMGLELAETFLEPSIHRMLRKQIEQAGNVGVLSLSDKPEKRKDPWDLDIPSTDKISEGTIAGLVIAIGSQTKGNIFDLKREKGIHSDTIPAILNDIFEIFSFGVEHGDLKDRYEKIIRGFRSKSSAPKRRSTFSAHQLCLGGTHRALDKLIQEKERIEGAKELVFYLLVSSLVRIEALTHWSGQSIGSWDDLRIERQRTLKREISGLFDLLDGVSSISTSLRKRMETYRTNMKVRRNISSLSRIKVISGDGGITGKGGETWKGKLVIDVGKESTGMDLSTSIRLPGLSWNLVSPNSQRDGPLFILPSEKVGKGGRYELEMKISTPSAISSTQSALIYLAPSFTRMEVED